jgi:DNA end-binding protein Ku
VPRPLWKGYISFGLVNLPIELRTAVRDQRPRFRLLHQRDLSPISMERVCQRDGKPVAWEDLVKGYEIEPGSFIAMTEDDFKMAGVERSRSIDIREFVRADDIDARYWDTPYLAAPGKGAETTYALLAAALEKSGRAGIAKYVMRERQHLAAVRGVGGQVWVSTLRFEGDFVATAQEHGVSAPVRAKELALAMQLIEGLASEWQPARYTDDYVPALMKVIEAKAAGPRPSRRAPRTSSISPSGYARVWPRPRATAAPDVNARAPACPEALPRTRQAPSALAARPPARSQRLAPAKTPGRHGARRASARRPRATAQNPYLGSVVPAPGATWLTGDSGGSDSTTTGCARAGGRPISRSA